MCHITLLISTHLGLIVKILVTLTIFFGLIKFGIKYVLIGRASLDINIKYGGTGKNE